jgi:hypothetical protein
MGCKETRAVRLGLAQAQPLKRSPRFFSSFWTTPSTDPTVHRDRLFQAGDTKEHELKRGWGGGQAPRSIGCARKDGWASQGPPMRRGRLADIGFMNGHSCDDLCGHHAGQRPMVDRIGMGGMMAVLPIKSALPFLFRDKSRLLVCAGWEARNIGGQRGEGASEGRDCRLGYCPLLTTASRPLQRMADGLLDKRFVGHGWLCDMTLSGHLLVPGAGGFYGVGVGGPCAASDAAHDVPIEAG